MIAAFAVSAAVLLAPLQEPEPTGDQWVCGGTADAWNGASVSIRIPVTADGSRLSEGSTWLPPRLGEVRPQNVHLNAPTLSLHYDQPLQAPLGAPSDICASITSDGGPETILQGLNVLLSVGDDAPITGRDPFDGRSQAVEKPQWMLGGLAQRHAAVSFEQEGLMARLAVARAARLVLVDADGRPLAETRYDLGATAQRNQLLEEARIKATASLRVPRHCDPTVGNTNAFPPEGS